MYTICGTYRLVTRFYILEVSRKQKEEDKKEDNNQDKINKAFETKQIGRPVGSWEDKTKQYFEWIK